MILVLMKVLVDGSVAELTFEETGLRWNFIGRSMGVLGNCLVDPAAFATHRLRYDEILCALRQEKVEPQPTYHHLPTLYGVTLYTFKRAASRSEWRPWRLKFQSHREEIIDELHLKVCNGLEPVLEARPRHLLVLINPNAGSGRADFLFQTVLRPVFSRGGITLDTVHTLYPGHATDIVYEKIDPEMYPENEPPFDGIVAVGGDGIFNEVVNGLFKLRKEKGDALNLTSLRLGHVPCGSTDAVACSLNGSRSVFTAAMHIALGDETPLDVLRVDISPSTTRYACCIATYGFMGDVVQASEVHRWLGPLRYDVIGAAMVVRNQSYKCRVKYVLAPSLGTELEIMPCQTSCLVCQHSTDRMRVSFSANQGRQEWKVEEGNWMSIMLIVQPCRSEKTPQGMARYGHLANGSFTLVLVRQCSMPQYLRFLASMSSNGLVPGQMMDGVVKVMDVVSCTVESLDGPKSLWNVDGELVDGSMVKADILPRAISCFARGVET